MTVTPAAGNGEEAQRLAGLATAETEDLLKRIQAVNALGMLGAAAAREVPALLRLLEDELFTMNVITALERIGPSARDAAGPLRALLARTSYDEMKVAIAAALWKITGDSDLPAKVLAKVPGEAFPTAVALGIKTVAEMKRPDALAFVVKALSNASGEARAAAAAALGDVGAADPKTAFDALRRALADREDDLVRYHAAVSWHRLGGDGARLVPVLVKLLETKSFKVTFEDEGHLKEGGRVVSDEVRLGIIKILGELGPVAAPAVRALAALEQDPAFSEAAERAVQRIRGS